MRTFEALAYFALLLTGLFLSVDGAFAYFHGDIPRATYLELSAIGCWILMQEFA